MTPEQSKRLDEVHAMLKAILRQTAPKQPMGDEKIFKDPKNWDGQSCIGSMLSAAPADWLRAYAKYKGACAYMGRKEADPAKVQYVERDEASAKLAGEWAMYREATAATLAQTDKRHASSNDDFDF